MIHRAKLVKHIIDHVIDPDELTDEEVNMLNNAVIAMRWCEETRTAAHDALLITT